jgi:hypothetical protein
MARSCPVAVLTFSLALALSCGSGSGEQDPPNGIRAASAALADVQAAVDLAANGDTVVVPAGTATWGDGGSALSVGKAITVQGAGRGKTVLTISATAGSYTSAIIRLSAPATVKGFTIQTLTSGGSGTAFSASADGFRITDIEYLARTSSTNGYLLYAGAYGLLDSCDITAGSGDDELIFARGPGDSWQAASSMGSSEALFIEDCIFRGPGYVTDCNSNARCVVRFDTITGEMKIDGHGKATNTPPRGVRQMEIYGNHWTSTASYWPAIELRGGTGRVFQNEAASAQAWFMLSEYAALGPYGNFGGVVQVTWPVDDQIGVGRDPKVGGSEPMYLWRNRAAGQVWTAGLGYGSAAELSPFIQADRDYFAETSSFDGTSGVGVGTTSQMNAITPTRVGVAFWVTDQGEWNARSAGADGELFRWSGSAWTLVYLPYQYPHPAR